MFIQTETTPNPATLKFLPGREVMTDGGADFFDSKTAEKSSPLANRLFKIPGVTRVFLGYDFITITKDETEWQHLKPAILEAIMEHFLTNTPVMSIDGTFEKDAIEEFYDPKDIKIVETIKALLDTRIRPAVAQDGGDITFCGFRYGTVFLKMKGACSGCPSSTATLKQGVQNLFRHFIPEVQQVEAISSINDIYPRKED